MDNFKDINIDNVSSLCNYEKGLTPLNSKNTESPIKIGPISTLEYRTSSGLERSVSTAKKETNLKSAQIISTEKGITLDEAMLEINPNWSEEKWTIIELNDSDANIDQEFSTESLSICCNSLISNKIYNDTIAIFNKDCVTYKCKRNDYMTHSGDIITPFGLRHKIEFIKDKITSEDLVGYIVSAPWISGSSKPVNTLISTNPILEIRTEDNDVKKRYVIANDYSDGDEFTACANAIITFKNGLWNIKIIKKFINGYADDTHTIVKEIY